MNPISSSLFESSTLFTKSTITHLLLIHNGLVRRYDESRSHLCDDVCLTRFADNSDQAQAYEEVTQRPHEAKWSHELIGGAAAYEAAKAYEDHVAQNGE